MYAIVEGRNPRHRANIQYQGFVRGNTGEGVKDNPKQVLFTFEDPYFVLDIISEVGGRVVSHGEYVNFDPKER